MALHSADAPLPTRRRVAIPGATDNRAAGRLAGERMEWVRADVTDLPFTDRCFDVVVLKDVLHHVADRDGVLSEAMRVLDRGGICAVIESNPENLVMGFIGRNADHAIVHSTDLDALLLRHGRIEQATTFNGYPFYGFVFFTSAI